ncbi:hypothetical protein [Streptomyces bacillaris]|uniref:hypothetical protein n=1 Tax=Streptomyces bacillaris TaxID=68179 RepID=UPI003460B7B5
MPERLTTLHKSTDLLGGSPVSEDLLTIVDWITREGFTDVTDVTGSFLVGVAGPRSDIDLVC